MPVQGRISEMQPSINNEKKSPLLRRIPILRLVIGTKM